MKSEISSMASASARVREICCAAADSVSSQCSPADDEMDNPSKNSDSSSEDESDFWDPREARAAFEAARAGNPSAQQLVEHMYMSGKLPPDLTATIDRVVPDSWEDD